MQDSASRCNVITRFKTIERFCSSKLLKCLRDLCIVGVSNEKILLGGQTLTTSRELNAIVDDVSAVLPNEIEATDLVWLVSETCAARAAKHPQFALLAGRVLVRALHRRTCSTFSGFLKSAYFAGFVSKSVYMFQARRSSLFGKIDQLVEEDRDFELDFFQLLALADSGCLINVRIPNESDSDRLKSFKVAGGVRSGNAVAESFLSGTSRDVVERPQYMYMRAAVFLHMNDALKRKIEYSDGDDDYDDDDDDDSNGDDNERDDDSDGDRRILSVIQRTYQLLSNGSITLSILTLANSCAKNPHLISDYFLSVESSNFDAISARLRECALISANDGNIEMAISKLYAANRSSGEAATDTLDTRGTLFATNWPLVVARRDESSKDVSSSREIRCFQPTFRAEGIINFVNALAASVKLAKQMASPYQALACNPRRSRITLYAELWHADIFDFLSLPYRRRREELLRNDSARLERDARRRNDEAINNALNIRTVVLIPDLFMERVRKDEMWTLFCPSECPGLDDVYGDVFSAKYVYYERNRTYREKILAKKLFERIVKTKIDTGAPYIVFKDTVNRANLHAIAGISERSTKEIFARFTFENAVEVRVSAAIALNRCVRGKKFDFGNLQAITRHAVQLLNSVAEKSTTAIPVADLSAVARRSRLSVRVQGFAETVQALELPFDSAEAKAFNVEVFKRVYACASKTAAELAENSGKRVRFSRSRPIQPIARSNGEMGQRDTVSPSETASLPESGVSHQRETVSRLEKRFDARTIFDRFAIFGNKEKRRRKLLESVALNLSSPTSDPYDVADIFVQRHGSPSVRPTVSSSLTLSSSDSVDPEEKFLRDITTTRGNFTTISKNLITHLEKRSLWTDVVARKLIEKNGSIQDIDEIPCDSKKIYRTAYELSENVMLEMAADRASYVDQRESTNLFLTGTRRRPRNVYAADYDRVCSALFRAYDLKCVSVARLRVKPSDASTQSHCITDRMK